MSNSHCLTQASFVMVTSAGTPGCESGCHRAVAKGDCSSTCAVGPTWKDLRRISESSPLRRWAEDGRTQTWQVWAVKTARRLPSGETVNWEMFHGEGSLRTCNAELACVRPVCYSSSTMPYPVTLAELTGTTVRLSIAQQAQITPS